MGNNAGVLTMLHVLRPTLRQAEGREPDLKEGSPSSTASWLYEPTMLFKGCWLLGFGDSGHDVAKDGVSWIESEQTAVAGQ